MALDKQHQSSLPFIIGQVAFFAMATAPAGFLKCAGQAVSRATYANLFAAIGTLYGAGNGSTTFNLPDLRGEFVRCFDDGKGTDAGRAFGSAQSDALQGHRHPVTVNGGSFVGFGYHPGVGSNQVDVAMNSVGAPISDGSNGTPRTAAETRPRNIALLACIFTGI